MSQGCIGKYQNHQSLHKCVQLAGFTDKDLKRKIIHGEIEDIQKNKQFLGLWSPIGLEKNGVFSK